MGLSDVYGQLGYPAGEAGSLQLVSDFRKIIAAKIHEQEIEGVPVTYKLPPAGAYTPETGQAILTAIKNIRADGTSVPAMRSFAKGENYMFFVTPDRIAQEMAASGFTDNLIAHAGGVVDFIDSAETYIDELDAAYMAENSSIVDMPSQGTEAPSEAAESPAVDKSLTEAPSEEDGGLGASLFGDSFGLVKQLIGWITESFPSIGGLLKGFWESLNLGSLLGWNPFAAEQSKTETPVAEDQQEAEINKAPDPQPVSQAQPSSEKKGLEGTPNIAPLFAAAHDGKSLQEEPVPNSAPVYDFPSLT